MCILHLHDLSVLSCLLVWLPDNHMGTAAYVKSLRQQYHRSIVMPMCGILQGFAPLQPPQRKLVQQNLEVQSSRV